MYLYCLTSHFDGHEKEKTNGALNIYFWDAKSKMATWNMHGSQSRIMATKAIFLE